MSHVGGPCWREIGWLIPRQVSPHGSQTMCLGTSTKGHSSFQSPLLYPSLVSLHRSESTAGAVLPGRLRKGCLFPSHKVKPSTIAYTKTATSQRYLSCYGKIACINMSLSAHHFFCSKTGQQRYSASSPALMHRAETSMRAKDEAYSGSANFEHTCTQAAKEMPILLQSNYITKVFSAFHFALLVTTVLHVFLYQ